MKALLLKDVLMLVKQKKTMLIVIIIGLMYAFMDLGTFGVMFLGMMCMIMAISTISYDEFDNGNPFLFSQPFTRKQYTIEKYLLAILGSIAGCLIGSVLTLAGSLIRRQETELGLIMAIFGGSVLLFGMISSFMLPMMLKNGAEKGRNSAYLVFGVIFIGVILIERILPLNTKESLLSALEHISPFVIISVIVLAVTLAMVISCRISIGFMEKREF